MQLNPQTHTQTLLPNQAVTLALRTFGSGPQAASQAHSSAIPFRRNEFCTKQPSGDLQMAAVKSQARCPARGSRAQQRLLLSPKNRQLLHTSSSLQGSSSPPSCFRQEFWQSFSGRRWAQSRRRRGQGAAPGSRQCSALQWCQSASSLCICQDESSAPEAAKDGTPARERKPEWLQGCD